MNNKINNLWIKNKPKIPLKGNFVRFDLLRKFFNYNNITYLLNCVRKCCDWMHNLQKPYEAISDSSKPTTGWCWSLSLHVYQFKAEITTLIAKKEML